MKIDHVSLTIFTWDNIPRTSYHAGSFTQPVSNVSRIPTSANVACDGRFMVWRVRCGLTYKLSDRRRRPRLSVKETPDDS